MLLAIKIVSAITMIVSIIFLFMRDEDLRLHGLLSLPGSILNLYIGHLHVESAGLIMILVSLYLLAVLVFGLCIYKGGEPSIDIVAYFPIIFLTFFSAVLSLKDSIGNDIYEQNSGIPTSAFVVTIDGQAFECTDYEVDDENIKILFENGGVYSISKENVNEYSVKQIEEVKT